MKPGICCEYCIKHEKPECPIKDASPWSRWDDYCGKFEAKPEFGNVPGAESAQPQLGDGAVENLKPCPFCGSQVEFINDYPYETAMYENRRGWISGVKCQNKNCHCNVYFFNGMSNVSKINYSPDKMEEVIRKRWNNRAFA